MRRTCALIRVDPDTRDRLRTAGRELGLTIGEVADLAISLLHDLGEDLDTRSREIRARRTP